MRSELKMIIAGFGAGALVGVVALTSVNASIDHTQSVRGDRLSAVVKPQVAYGDIDPASVVSHVELIGPKGTVVEFRDPQGRIVFRSDPVTNTTVVAKNTIIPSFTVLERVGDRADLKLVNTASDSVRSPATQN
jgi:hypothetical protein